jgi:hypothetical protein
VIGFSSARKKTKNKNHQSEGWDPRHSLLDTR